MKVSYQVVVFVNHDKRQFSLTARRSEGARLEAVKQQMIDESFTPLVIASGLDKNPAEQFKQILKAAYIEAGYSYVSREPLS